MATRGGATEGTVQVLRAELPATFTRAFEAAMRRHVARKTATRAAFLGEAAGS